MKLSGRGINERRWIGAAGLVICAMGLVLGAAPQGQDDETRDITKDWKPKRAQSQTASTAKIPPYSVKAKIPKAQDRVDSAGLIMVTFAPTFIWAPPQCTHAAPTRKPVSTGGN